MKCYLNSAYRASLLDRRRKSIAACITVETAKIVHGRPEDDEKIIDFLRKLGDVEAVVREDTVDVLRFNPGTFDNWISRDDFKKACEVCDELEFIDFGSVVYWNDGKIANSDPREDSIHLIFDPINCIFEVEGSLQFPQVHDVVTSISLENVYSLWKRGYRRHKLELEQPLRLDTLEVVSRRDTSCGYVVVAGEGPSSISIVEPKRDNWLTRKEALSVLKRRAVGKDYLRVGRYYYKAEKIREMNITNIANCGLVNSMDIVHLQDIESCDVFNIEFMSYDHYAVSDRVNLIVREKP